MIALQRNSPSPSQVYKLIWKAEVPVARFRNPTINRVISGFFHTPRALAVPQERNAGSSVGPMNQRSSVMSRTEQYRHLATDVRSRASREANPMLKAEWENLAETYVRLAEQSDDKWDTDDLTYDPIQDMLDRTRH